MGLRGELGFLGEADFRAARVVRDGQRLDEALRCACDERELYVDPVCAGGVVDDGPALQRCGLAFGIGSRLGIGEENAVGGFPDGDFADVTDVKLAGSAAVVLQREVAKTLVARAGEQLQVAGDVGVQVGVEQADLSSGGEFHGADFTGLADDGDDAFLAWRLIVLSGGVGDFDVEQAPVMDVPRPWTSTRAPRMAL